MSKLFKNTTVDPTPDFERKIDVVIERVAECEKHPSTGDEQYPCYTLPLDTTIGADRSHNWGVCNWRARQAGFVGVPPAPKPKVNSQFNRS